MKKERTVVFWYDHYPLFEVSYSDIPKKGLDDFIISAYRKFDAESIPYITVEIEREGCNSWYISYRVFEGVLRKMCGSSTTWKFVHNFYNQSDKIKKRIPDHPRYYRQINGFKESNVQRKCRLCGQPIIGISRWFTCKPCHNAFQQTHHNKTYEVDCYVDLDVPYLDVKEALGRRGRYFAK